MLILQSTELPKLPIEGLRWVQDLEHFDGPLISLFRSKKNHNYIHYWVDCDSKCNRWLVFRISETDLLRLTSRKIPFSHLIPDGLEDDFVYFADLDTNGEEKKIYQVTVANIPEQYTPRQGSYLSHVNIQNDGQYNILVENTLSVQNVREILGKFTRAYAFKYNVDKLNSAMLKMHPWRNGGYNSMHFSREIVDTVPAEHRPQLRAMQFASPGYIRYNLDTQTAVEIGNVVAHFAAESDKCTKASIAISRYIRDNGLNNLPDGDSGWGIHNHPLSLATLQLLKTLQLQQVREFMRSCETPMHAAKMSQYFYRLIKDLASLESDGLISLPNRYDEQDEGMPLS